MIETAVVNGFFEATDKVSGWKIRTALKPGCGVTPMLALRETRHVLALMETRVMESTEAFHEVITHVRTLWDGMRFRMPLVAFPNKPVVEIEPLLVAAEPPTLLRAVFTSIQDSKE